MNNSELSGEVREKLRSRWERHVALMGSDDVSPRRVEMRRLAAAGRTVIDSLVKSEAPEEVLSEAADRLTDVADALMEYSGKGHIYGGFAESANSGDPHANFDHSPLLGEANPLSPPIRLRIEGDKMIGEVTFGSGYEGPPTCVHGGFIAAGFDELLGAAQTFSGQPGMTGTLTVIYRRPTPLRQPVVYEAWLERTEGRKNIVRGTLTHEGTLCAEAEGIFIAVNPEVFGALIEAADQSRP